MSRTKLLGAFYTPTQTAESLARWAIRTGFESVLEPSVGSGALIKAVINQADRINGQSKCKVLAFDIDPKAVSLVVSQRLSATMVIHADFLLQCATDFEQVDVVIANPPFIRHHAIEKKLRESLRRRFDVPGMAGLWASFILHSLSFLKRGGRLATIVPRSVLFTKHGEEFMQKLCSHFKQIGIYEFIDRPSWSTHAEEAGAVILGEGFGLGRTDKYLKGVVAENGIPMVKVVDDSSEFSRISTYACLLGAIAKISIGAVTGRNKIFLISELDRVAAGISRDDVMPVVSRSKHVFGTKVTKSDLLSLAKGGERTWLLKPRKLTPSLNLYLSAISVHERESVVWFKKRRPWWLVQTDIDYDAVLTYMNDTGPRIALLDPCIVCTNTLHKLTFLEGVSAAQKRSAVLGLLSTFGQVAAEKIGRAYGGGVLKFEIGEARRLPVLCEGIEFDENTFSVADQLMRLGKKEEARELIDEVFMPVIFGDEWKHAQAKLLDELTLLRIGRRGTRSKEL